MLWDNPPHVTNSFTVTTATDAGGGTSLSYSAAQSNIPCLISTSGAAERELFAQQGVVVTHCVSYLSSVLTTPLTRGMKLTDEGGNSYHVRGIRSGRVSPGGTLPAFTYADVEQQL